MEEEVKLVVAFTAEQASRVTGVSTRQLAYWARTGFFPPSLPMVGEGMPMLRLYSFRDLVGLKVIGQLRNEIGVSLPHLREVKDHLSVHGDDAFARTTLYVLGRRVVYDNPETGRKEDAGNGQGVLSIPLKVVTSDMRAAVAALRQRDPDSIGKVHTLRAASRNPVVAGTRIPVRSIRAFSDAGYSVDQIIAQYPTLTPSDVEAALAFKRIA